MRPILRTAYQTAIGLTAVLGVAAAIAHYLQEPYNPGFAEYPSTVALHVILGGLYLALAPFQFVGRIRQRYPSYHRQAGRWIIGLGLVAGLSAVVMSIAIPFSGNAERILVTPFAVFFLFALARSLDYARAKQFAEHRAWMIRAFAVASSIATMRLIFIPTLIWIGQPTMSQTQFLSVTSFLVAFVIHGAAAELWIHNTRTTAIVRAGSVQVAAT